MAFAKTQDQVDLVANVLAALENAPTTVHAAPLCVISRDLPPATVLAVFADGQRFQLTPDDVDLTTQILLGAQPFPGCTAIAHALQARLAQAELLTFRANAVRMLTPMGRG